MTEQRHSPGRSSGGTIGRILRFIVRLILVLVIGGLVGLGIYLGVPWAYRSLVWPVQDNRARVAILEQRMDLEQEHLRERERTLQDRSYELEDELAKVEAEVARLREQVAVQAEDQEGLEAQTGRLGDQVVQLEADVEAQRLAMEAATEDIRADLGDATAGLNRGLEDLQDELSDIIANLAPQVEETREELIGVDGRLGELEGRLALLQAAQDLVKVRLLLVEDNPGTARNTLALAITHVEQASALMPLQAETLAELQTQMTALDGPIAQRSFRARPDLETIWAGLMDLVVPVPLTNTPGVTATQATSPLPTPTSSP